MNPKESEDPIAIVEFERGKHQIKTLVESGAVDFIEKLQQSLLDNPELSTPTRFLIGDIFNPETRESEKPPNAMEPFMGRFGIHIEKKFYVRDSSKVSQLRQKENDELCGFTLVSSKYEKHAVVGLFYNPRESSVALMDEHLPLPLSLMRRPIGRYQYILFDTIQAICFEPGKLRLSSKTAGGPLSRNDYGARAIDLTGIDSTSQARVNRVLGDLCAQRPAKSR